LRTLIFEPDSQGHRLHYVGLIADVLAHLGHEVTVALSSQARVSREFATHLRSLPPTVEYVEFVDAPHGNPWIAAGHRLRALSDTLRSIQPEHAYVPYADGLTQRGSAEARLGIRRLPTTTYIEALHLRGHFAYPSPDRTSRILRRTAGALIRRAPWSFLHLLDPLAYEYMRESMEAPAGHGPEFDLVPEPVEPGFNGSRSDARDRLGLDPDSQYVGIVGGINTRKGCDLLLGAFREGLGPGVKLMLAGRHDADIRAALDSDFSRSVREGSIVSVDEYVSQDRLRDTIMACDVLTLPYRDHSGSSAIAVRAAAAARPLVTSEYGWLGECVRRFELGATCDATDQRVLAATIRSVLQDEAPFKLNERARRFIGFNTVDNFKAAWARQIRLRSGQQPQSTTKTWDWVMTGDSPAEES